jgi:hypothetical protein
MQDILEQAVLVTGEVCDNIEELHKELMLGLNSYFPGRV